MDTMHFPLLAALLSILAFSASFTSAGDPDMLQDVCVADLNSEYRVNGFACKPMAEVTIADFHSPALAQPGNTTNKFGSSVTAAPVTVFPGINTLGVSMARIDYAPGGLNPPHTHPRATELIFVTEGSLVVGFTTTGDKLFQQTVNIGEMFVFPRGLVHFQWNNNSVKASVVAAFNSQFPGTQKIGSTLFAASPPIADEILANSFMVGEDIVDEIKNNFM